MGDYQGKKPSVLGLGRRKLKEGLCVLGAAISSFKGTMEGGDFRGGSRHPQGSPEHEEDGSTGVEITKEKYQKGQLRIERGHKREVGLGREPAQRAQAGKLVSLAGGR